MTKFEGMLDDAGILWRYTKRVKTKKAKRAAKKLFPKIARPKPRLVMHYGTRYS